MKIERIRFAALSSISAALFLALAACAPAATPAPAAPTALPMVVVAPTTAPVVAAAPTAVAPAAVPPQAKAVTLQLAKNDQLGTFISDGAGNTLYLFGKDVPNTSNCYDKCAQSWPALLPAGAATLKDGVNAALVGTTQRTDGTTQLTYNGWPLYYFANDSKPGDTTGQAVGNIWWVVSAEGNPIKPAALKINTNDKLGKFLSDDSGRTVYAFTKDTKDTSACYDKCEQAWPPLLETGKPTLGDGIDASLLGSTQRKDGTTQVTYNGMPLYYFAKDSKPGDTTGQGVGTVWFVVAQDGSLVKTPIP